MIRFVREQGTPALILKFYFRFGRKNSKWPPKTGFSSIKRELIEIFSKFKRQIFRFHGSDQLKILVQKIYFRFGLKNSKWPPKTGFLPIRRELIEIFSKFKRQIFRFHGSDQLKILVQKTYFRFGGKNSKWPPKTGFSPIKRELIEIFSKF